MSRAVDAIAGGFAIKARRAEIESRRPCRDHAMARVDIADGLFGSQVRKCTLTRVLEQAERMRGGAAFRVRWKFSGKGQLDQITL